MKILKKGIGILIVFISSIIFANERGDVIHIKKTISDDATVEVLGHFMSGKKISEMKFEKGVYHFYPDKALERMCYISNHEDVLTRTAFPLINLNNLQIDGQGSKFIFHGRMIPFLVENSKSISIKNLTIDWEVPFHAEGLVVDNNPAEKTIDLKFSERDSYEIRNGELFFVKEYYEHTIGQNILFDSKRRAVYYKASNYGVATHRKIKPKYRAKNIIYKYKGDHQTIGQINKGKESFTRAVELKPGLVRIHTMGKNVPPIGSVLVGKGEKGLNRVSPAFRVKNAEDFVANNVTVNHANGMGFICENSKNITLDQFNVTPSEGRVLSTTADATHFVGCRGKIIIKNSLLECQMDDAMNVHGVYQEVVEVLDKKTIGVRIGHHEQQNYTIGKEGDIIGLVRLSNSFKPYGSLVINSIQRINGRYHKITFKESIPATIKVGDLLENISAYPEVVVENCIIRGNRARGLLISTPKKTVIKNNFFHTQMEAILMPVESNSWFESGSVSNLEIIGNTFENCNHGGRLRGVIRFHTDDANENIAFENIRIKNNIFNQFNNQILEVTNVNGLKFEKNTITHTATFPQIYPESSAFVVKKSNNIIFKNNHYNGVAKNILESDTSTNKKIKFN